MTEQEKQEIIEAIKASSTDINTLVEAASLDGIVTLPGIRGKELVSVPVTLLADPAIQAALNADAKAQAAQQAADNATAKASAANTAATNANAKAEAAQTAADNANTAAGAAQQVVMTHEDIALRAKNGATAVFKGFVEDANIQQISSSGDASEIYFIKAKHTFAAKMFSQGEEVYCANWLGWEMYIDKNRKVLKAKAFLFDNKLYVFDGAANTLVLSSPNLSKKQDIIPSIIDAYVDESGNVVQYQGYNISIPYFLKRGESLVYQVAGSGVSVLSETDVTGSFYKPVSTKNSLTYIAERDIYVALSYANYREAFVQIPLAEAIELSKPFIGEEENIKSWILSESYTINSCERDGDNSISSAEIVFPNGVVSDLDIIRDAEGNVTTLNVRYDKKTTYTMNVDRDAEGNVIKTTINNK